MDGGIIGDQVATMPEIGYIRSLMSCFGSGIVMVRPSREMDFFLACFLSRPFGLLRTMSECEELVKSSRAVRLVEQYHVPTHRGDQEKLNKTSIL